MEQGKSGWTRTMQPRNEVREDISDGLEER